MLTVPVLTVPVLTVPVVTGPGLAVLGGVPPLAGVPGDVVTAGAWLVWPAGLALGLLQAASTAAPESSTPSDAKLPLRVILQAMIQGTAAHPDQPDREPHSKHLNMVSA